jgi:hypothetical protein
MATEIDPTTSAGILIKAEPLAKWQMEHMPNSGSDTGAGEGLDESKGWQQGTFWLGMTALADRSHSVWVREALDGERFSQ